MIKSWRLKAFKSVFNSTTLEMAPLTIFSGANSSGKSTIIQSILLTAQTLQSPVQTKPIILNGHIIRLGSFDDLMSNGSSDKQIEIGFQILPNEFEKATPLTSSIYSGSYFSRLKRMINQIECNFSFTSQGPEDQKDVLQLQPRLEKCEIKVKAKIEDRDIEDEVGIRRSTKTIEERLKHFQISVNNITLSDLPPLEYEVIKPQNIRHLRRFYGLPETGKPAGATLQHFLPGRIAIVFDAVEEQSKQIVLTLTSPEGYPFRNWELSAEDEKFFGDSFMNLVNKIFDELLAEIQKTENASENKLPPPLSRRLKEAIGEMKNISGIKVFQKWLELPASVKKPIAKKFQENTNDLLAAAKNNRGPEYSIAFSPLPELSEAGVDFTKNFFSRFIKYLGPLRDEPKPVYPLAGATDPRDVGFKGEHTAAVLEVHRNTTIEYFPSKSFLPEAKERKIEKTTLLKAVLDWLEYMGVASNVETHDKGKLGHELKVATSGGSSLHDLTHVGVGVSQVLPILVLSLLAESGSTLVFEQPELHLHPRVQTRLADFFVSLTMLGKQCIVETHSEYLINRLRYRSAVSEGEEISQSVVIYFVEKEQGRSSYRPVRINKFGVIGDWPRGFFDENEENAASILKAGMEKRKKEAKNKNA